MDAVIGNNFAGGTAMSNELGSGEFVLCPLVKLPIPGRL